MSNQPSKDKRISGNDTKNISPIFLTATSGDTEGEIDLTWEPAKGASTYLVQKSSDSGNPVKWINEDIAAKSSYTVTKLKSGRKYWFRVAAVKPKGQSIWSNHVQKKAP